MLVAAGSLTGATAAARKPSRRSPGSSTSTRPPGNMQSSSRLPRRTGPIRPSRRPAGSRILSASAARPAAADCRLRCPPRRPHCTSAARRPWPWARPSRSTASPRSATPISRRWRRVTTDFSYSIDWGDGSQPFTGSHVDVVAAGGGSLPFLGDLASDTADGPLTHVYANTGTYYVAVTVTASAAGFPTRRRFRSMSSSLRRSFPLAAARSTRTPATKGTP